MFEKDGKLPLNFVIGMTVIFIRESLDKFASNLLILVPELELVLIPDKQIPLKVLSKELLSRENLVSCIASIKTLNWSSGELKNELCKDGRKLPGNKDDT